MIFSKNHDFPEILENTTFFTFESEKVLENDFFDRNFNFPEKYGTSAPDWYIYFGRTPRSSRDLMLQTRRYTFVYNWEIPNFNTFHIVIYKHIKW